MSALRFGTFNLLHGLSLATGAIRQDDLRASAVALDADVLALQEVDRGQPRSNKVDQAAVVAEELGAPWWRFGPAVDGIPGRRMTPADPLSDAAGPACGVALVSRLRVLRWYARRFPAAPVPMLLHVARRPGLRLMPDHPRVALAGVLVGPDGPFTVVAAHLSFVPGWNVRQLRAIARWLAGMPAPRFLLADLNIPGPLPRAISGWEQLARVPTYPSWRPCVQWDHVLADGVGRGDVRTVTAQRQPVSDHTSVTVDVTWPVPSRLGD